MTSPENKQFTIVSSKKTKHILPNILTLVGVCLGISSIKFAIDQNYSFAVLFILLAAFLDALDGRVARLIKATSDFGKELDSLTDFVSFGIAPAFILYFWELNKYGKIGWAITLIFSVCCVLRLARFNLTEVKEGEFWKKNYFEGVPSPAGGILILAPLIYDLSVFKINFTILNINLGINNFTPYFTLVIAFLLISKIPTFSFKKITISAQFTPFILLGVGVIFAALMLFTFETLLILLVAYLILIPISSILYIIKYREIKNNLVEDDHDEVF